MKGKNLTIDRELSSFQNVKPKRENKLFHLGIADELTRAEFESLERHIRKWNSKGKKKKKPKLKKPQAPAFHVPGNCENRHGMTGKMLFIQHEDNLLEEGRMNFYFGPEDSCGGLYDQHADWVEDQLKETIGADYIQNEAEGWWTIDIDALFNDDKIEYKTEPGCEPNEFGEIYDEIYCRFFQSSGVEWRGTEEDE